MDTDLHSKIPKATPALQSFINHHPWIIIVAVLLAVLAAICVYFVYYVFCRQSADSPLVAPQNDALPVAQPNPLPNTIDASILPSTEYTTELDGYGDRCPICLEMFKVGESVFILPNCRHINHRGCDLIEGELGHGRFFAVCPICRVHIELPDFV